MKKILYIILILTLIGVWSICFRNQCKKEYSVREYGLNNNIVLDNCELTATKLCILSNEELKSQFSITNDSMLQCDKYAVAYFDISCDQSKWNDDSIENLISCGFLRKSWYNGVNPMLFYGVNKDNIDMINKEFKGSFCVIGAYNSIMNYSENDKLEYVITSYPELIKVIAD